MSDELPVTPATDNTPASATPPECAPARGARVLILVENASVPHDRRVLQEARSLLSAGYGVSVICPALPGEASSESLDGIEIRRYRPAPSSGGAISQIAEYANALFKTFWLMIRMSATPGFDVIQACNPPDLFILIAWPFKLAGKRFVFDQHDLSPELYSTLYGKDSGPVMAALKATERLSYGGSDAVIVTNESYRGLARSRGGVAGDRVFVVRNGPREGWPLDVAPDPGLRAGRRHLALYVGVMGHQDGVDVLLEAVAVLKHEMGYHDAAFALVGSGNAEATLKERARELDVEDLVRFCGWVSDEEVLSCYLRTADVCLSPEPSSPLNDHSTFIKVMEYMASLTPVVAFDLPETRFSAGGAAVYATPGDVDGFARHIHDVLTDEALRQTMLAEAKRRIPSLRWDSQVPALLQAYERALS